MYSKDVWKHNASSMSMFVAFAGLCVVTPANAQQMNVNATQTTTTPFNARNAIERLNSGVVSSYDLGKLGKANVSEAIPALEKQFFAAQDPMDKADLAQTLVKLKSPNDIYWKYLETLVTSVLDKPSPYPIRMDADDKEVRQISPAFDAWVDANRLNPPEALQNATVIYPAYMLLLGQTADLRAIPLLRRALSSSNYLIAASASEALVDLKDEDSATAIADAAEKAPKDAAQLIAEPLASLESPTAQSAFTRHVPPEQAKALREEVRLEKAKQQ